MKTKKAQQNVTSPREWITIREVMAITHHTSRNGVKTFAMDHGLHVNNKTGKLLFIKQEVYDALDNGAERMGI